MDIDGHSLLQTVYNAIKAGYRLFDGAADYGNEKECGEGIHRAIKEGLVTREEICEYNYPLIAAKHIADRGGTQGSLPRFVSIR